MGEDIAKKTGRYLEVREDREVKSKILGVILEDSDFFQNNDELKKSVEAYINYVILKKKKYNFEIKLWKEFFDDINKEDGKDKDAQNSNVKAVLFLTYEKLPFGDEENSLWNKSRATRMFFECFGIALSSDYKNVLLNLKKLILNAEFGKV
ncbi:MAG: hypothetical protein B6D55_04555 [Candidatus Omnitrophica bacterium 4484_70.2]|nr:MAG: hypothetical protein B6D55_04555 [Candidatus Omnitrophica bacterium 4484_70.2]